MHKHNVHVHVHVCTLHVHVHATCITVIGGVTAAGNEDFRWADGYPAGMQHMASTLHWGMRYDDNRYYLTSLGR